MYPHERSLVKKFAGKPFVLLGVNSDSDKDGLRKAMEKEQITWRSWFDGGSTRGPIAGKYRVSGWPTLYVLDAQGVIRFKYEGAPGGDTLDQHIEELLKELDSKTS